MLINWNAMCAEVKELLIEKGFIDGLNDKWELAALLHTEVVELQLAETAEEEELELADLFIRAMNLVLANGLDLNGCRLDDTGWIKALEAQKGFRLVDCLNYAIVQYTEAIKKKKGLAKENEAIAMIFQALLEYVHTLGLDVTSIFRKKMDINWQRPYKYGSGLEEAALS